jgi:hypothetical protein
MLHDKRVWCLSEVESAEDLARKLTETTWCCCTAFRLEDYAWLNDSTSPDGAQEYAVLKLNGPDGDPQQVESITFGWCDYEKALAFIQATLAGEDDGNDWARPVSPALQSPQEHGRCGHCA